MFLLHASRAVAAVLVVVKFMAANRTDFKQTIGTNSVEFIAAFKGFYTFLRWRAWHFWWRTGHLHVAVVHVVVTAIFRKIVITLPVRMFLMRLHYKHYLLNFRKLMSVR